MTLAKAKAKTNETFIVQASLAIFTYHRKNMFIVQAIGGKIGPGSDFSIYFEWKFKLNSINSPTHEGRYKVNTV